MPLNCRNVTLNHVLKFFLEDIEGMGLKDGHPRNQGTPQSLKQYNDWKLCQLTEFEFQHLLIPDGENILIFEKEISSTEGDSRATTEKWFALIEVGQYIPPIIVRSKLLTERGDMSFAIMDGAHRAIAYKEFFKNHHYTPIYGYIGIRIFS